MNELLFHKLRDKDDEAYREFFAIYKGRIYAYSFSVTRNASMAEEVTQKVFIRVYTKISQVKHYKKFDSWLYRVVYNLSLDELKRKEIKNEIQIGDSIEDVMNESFDRLDGNYQLMWEEVDKLKEHERVVVIGKYMYQMSDKEIAKALNIHEGTVRSRLTSARKNLSKSFKKNNITWDSFTGFLSPTIFLTLFEGVNQLSSYQDIGVITPKLKSSHTLTKVKIGIVASTCFVGGAFIIRNVNNKQQETAYFTPETLSVVSESVEEKVCSIEGVNYQEGFHNTQVPIDVILNCDEYDKVLLNGSEHLYIQKNGNQIVEVVNKGSVIEQYSFDYNYIDDDSPNVISAQYKTDGYYEIVVEDTFSGLESLSYAENTRESNQVMFDQVNGRILFEYKVGTVYEMYIYDKAGNYTYMHVSEEGK